MATRRSAHFNADVNPALLSLVEGMDFPGYTVQANSGYRPGDRRQHGRGQAIDIQLIDPKGTALGNYHDTPQNFGVYQQYANALYQQALKTNPELAQQLRWGGYFSGGPGRYGALDLMHFDTAAQKIGMAGGSWAGGLTPAQAKIWNLSAGGGIGDAAPPVAASQQQGPPMPEVGSDLATARPAGPVEAAGGGAGSDIPAAAVAAPAASPAAPTTMWQRIAKNIGKMGPAGGIGDIQRTGGIPAAPAAARLDQGETPTIDPQGAEMQRQMLAAAMARLNSGRLF
jgi:hypothetical protein